MISKILTPKMIESGRYWTKAWYLVHGCTPVIDDLGPSGCEHCWAAAQTNWLRKNMGLTGVSEHDGPRFNGQIKIMTDRLEQPHVEKKSQVYAVWNDLFHEDVPFSFIADAFAVMMGNPRHVFFVVTKRPHIARKFFESEAGFEAADIPNVVGMMTAVTQRRLEAGIEGFLDCPFSTRMLSIEPMRGPMDLTRYLNFIDGVILGGESGPKASPMNKEWPVIILDQCLQAGVPFFFKQWGEWYPESYLDLPEEMAAKEDRLKELFGKVPNYLLNIYERQGWYRIGKKKQGRWGRILSGQTWDQFPKIEINIGGKKLCHRM